MTSVRFFTSAALRSREEVDGEIVRWLPRWSVVEFEGGRPVTGVWQSHSGGRRVCWYDSTVGALEVHAMHQERYGDEPYWIVIGAASDSGKIEVEERGADGVLGVRRSWTFDRDGMPVLEEEFNHRGVLRCRRRYQCIPWGVVIGLEEERAPAFAPVDRGRPATFPIPELAGEPYPCGGRLGAARIVDVISQNVCQGRYRAVVKVDGAWRDGVATLVAMKGGLSGDIQRRLDLVEPLLSEELGRGRLDHPRQRGDAFRGVLEACPDGESIETIVSRGRIAPVNAVALALQISDLLRRVAGDGRPLGAIRPELVYARPGAGGLTLTGVMHRGPAIASVTYAGEAVLVPPLFETDFSSPDDVAGLAQLVWYMVTCAHAWYAPEDVRWQLAWDDFHEHRRRRQAWIGPPALGPVLEEAIFSARRGSLHEFTARLAMAATAS